MVHEGIFATLAECTAKAGENVDTTGWVEANINDWAAQSESYINCKARQNFSDTYTTLNTDTKRILSEASSNLVAIYGIIYNMGGYTTRIEAEDMINVMLFRFNQCLKLLEDQRVVDFINGS